MADPEVDANLALDLARRLVQTPSVNPLGDPLRLESCNEGAVAGLLLAEILRMGVPARRVLVARRRPMVLAEWGQGPGPTLMINSHLDTVGVEGMPEPFSGEDRDGSLFGRGSADTKGGVAAAVAAFAAVVRSRPQPTRGPKVLRALVPDEEHAGLGSQYLRDHGPHANAAVVVEPTGLRLGIGLAWVLVIVAEMMAVKSGLGFVMWDAYYFLRLDIIIAAMLSVGALGFLSDLAIQLVGRWVMRWSRGL